MSHMSAAVDLVRPIAHRGLHAARQGVIENTETAFKAAIAKGYGIECDLQAASDLEPMVFHDERLKRLTTASGLVRERSPAELRRLQCAGRPTASCRLSEMLEMVAGKVPLLIEVKSEWARNDRLRRCRRPAPQELQGPYGIMSFDPSRVRPFCELLPHAPRGIVAGGIRSDLTMPRWIRRWNARKLLTNHIARPDFIDYFVRGLPGAAPVLSRRPEDLPLFTWTVRSPADRAEALQLRRRDGVRRLRARAGRRLSGLKGEPADGPGDYSASEHRRHRSGAIGTGSPTRPPSVSTRSSATPSSPARGGGLRLGANRLDAAAPLRRRQTPAG